MHSGPSDPETAISGWVGEEIGATGVGGEARGCKVVARIGRERGIGRQNGVWG